MWEREAIIREITRNECSIDPVPCAGCAGRCGSGLLMSNPRRSKIRVRCPSELPLSPGDRVVLAVSARSVWRLSFRVYLLPLMYFLSGGMLARHVVDRFDVIPADIAVVMGSTLAFSLSIWRLKRSAAAARCDFGPIILRRL
jgi:positive regulator of sigma E activity